MAQHKPPIGAEAVIYNALAQAISTGPLTWEAEVRSDSEKSEEVHWIACHVLARLLQEGFQLSRKSNDGDQTGDE
jgi:hypothetical protein